MRSQTGQPSPVISASQLLGFQFSAMCRSCGSATNPLCCCCHFLASLYPILRAEGGRRERRVEQQYGNGQCTAIATVRYHLSVFTFACSDCHCLIPSRA